MRDEFKPHRHNAICDRCGFKYKSDQLRREWNGLRVCAGPATNDCWEPRHPQEFQRFTPDKQAPEWTRPEGVDKFLATNEVSADDL